MIGGGPARALILANGDLPPARVVRALASRVRAAGGIVVCADGGLRHAARLGFRPDALVGDRDSAPPRLVARFRRAALPRDPDQESTDLEKAIRYCLAAGCRSAEIVGAIGDRIDHSTGALACLRKFGRRIDLTLHDRSGTLRLLARRENIAVRRGEVFSLIPLTRCRGIVLRGAAYPLRGETLELGVREGISNRATGRSLEIRHAAGALLLYRLR